MSIGLESFIRFGQVPVGDKFMLNRGPWFELHEKSENGSAIAVLSDGRLGDMVSLEASSLVIHPVLI